MTRGRSQYRWFKRSNTEKLVLPNFKIDSRKDFRSSKTISSGGVYFTRAWTFQEYFFSNGGLS
jgi:hypothetical protein